MDLSWRRTQYDRKVVKRTTYGIMYKLWDLYGRTEPPLALATGVGHVLGYSHETGSRIHVSFSALTMLDDTVLD